MHRSGRTARAGAAGSVVSLVADGERGAVVRIQKALGLPTGMTPMDLGVIPPAPPRPVIAERDDRKPRRERTERPRNDRPRQNDPRWETRDGSRPERPARQDRPERTARPEHTMPANRGERRAAEYAGRDNGPQRAERGQHSESHESRTPAGPFTRTNDITRPGETRAPLRSRQAEQPYRREPDGEARGERGAKRSPSRDGQQGMLRFYDQKKGFGFIIRPGAPDLFVHASALAGVDPRELTDGRTVAYEVEQGRKGEQASGVRLTDRPRVGGHERPSPRPGARGGSGPRQRGRR